MGIGISLLHNQPSQPFWLIPTNLDTAIKWLNFECDDIELILSHRSDAVFVAQLNTGKALRQLLAALSRFKAVVFRTSDPAVTEWAMRYDAFYAVALNQRPRYLFIRAHNAAWFRLCERAFNSLQRKQQLN